MKTTIRGICVVFCLLLMGCCFGDMVITGVIDGPLTGGEPKAIELYVLRDIPDLSIYGVGSANNGEGSDGEEFTFPTVAATAGDFIYVSYDEEHFHAFLGFDPDYSGVGAANINGDDAIELFKDGQVFDTFGNINADGTGTAWDYLDGWAYRNDNTGPDGATFVEGNWSFSGINALDGESQNATAANPFPIGSYSPPPIAIELASFSASQQNNGVLLQWQTAMEINCAGFFLHRSASKRENYTTITEQMIPAANVRSGQTYTFFDTPPAMQNYFYKLEEISLDGQRSFYGPISSGMITDVAQKTNQPQSLRLVTAWPNPFNSRITLEFTLETEGFVEIGIYDATGKRIREFRQFYSHGTFRLPWDGQTENGAAPSGLYFAQITTSQRSQTVKLTLLR